MPHTISAKNLEGASSSVAKPGECRLCGAETNPVFNHIVLGKFDVSYLQCVKCRSLQTEQPYWLTEAYANDTGTDKANLADLDTGAAQRNMMSLAATLWIAQQLKLVDVVDYGGGDGLLVRLLRDYGINAYVTDRYAPASYARGFTNPNFATPDLITAFEVFEHFPDPRSDVSALFEQKPVALLISTTIYSGEGADWWYLVPQTGQHVFFYSDEAMRLLAQRFNYELIRAGAYTLFVQPGRLRRLKLIKLGLRYRALKLLRSAIMLRAAPGVERDFEHLQLKNNSHAEIEV